MSRDKYMNNREWDKKGTNIKNPCIKSIIHFYTGNRDLTKYYLFHGSH